MFDEHRCWNGFLVVENTERQGNKVVAVSLRKIRNGAHQASTLSPQLLPRFTNRVLTDRRAQMTATRFLESTESSKYTHIIHSGNECPFRASASKEAPDRTQVLLKIPFPSR